MKKFIRKVSTFTLLASSLLSFTSAHAQQGCVKPQHASENNACMRKAFTKANREMNATYQKLLSTLGLQDKQRLTFSQRRWMTERLNACQLGKTEYLNLECVTNKTIQRTNFLQTRLHR